MTKAKGQYADAAEDVRSKRKQKTFGEYKEPEFRWCNVRLSESAKDTIMSMQPDPGRFVEWSFARVDEGYKVGISVDERSGCYLLTLICRRRSAPDFNVGLSARHDDWIVAMNTLMYKFDIMCFGGPLPTEDVVETGGVWD